MPRVPGYILPELAGPAHTGVFQIAVRRDQQTMQMEQRLGSNLGLLQSAIDRGEVDDIPTLRSIVARLNAKQFPDQGFARQARGVIQAANRREAVIQALYRDLLPRSPELKNKFDNRFRDLLAPAPRR
jgi:hypothetical protein